MTAQDRSLPELLRWRVQLDPDAVAIRKKRAAGWQTYTWRESLEQVEALAGAFQQFGVQPGDRLLVLGRPDPEMIWTAYAAWAVGGVTIALWPGAGTSDVQEVIESTTPILAIVAGAAEIDQLRQMPASGSLRAALHWEGGGEIPGSESLTVQRFKDFVNAAAGVSRTFPVMRSTDLAAMFRTSGSTGVPKVACHTHGTIIAATSAFIRALPSSADNENVPNFNLAAPAEPVVGTVNHLLTGMRLAFGGSGDTFDETIAEVPPHYLWMMPYQWESYVASLTNPDPLGDGVHPIDSSRVRWPITGGYLLADSAIAALRDAGLNLYKIYASAEMLIVAAGECRPSESQGMGTIFPEVEATVREGELYVRWPGLFTGYWSTDGVVTGVLDEGWYATGDLAELDASGGLRIFGRRPDAGQLADPRLGLLEAHLRSVTLVKDAFCAPVTDDGFIALVSLRQNPANAPEEIHQRLLMDIVELNNELGGSGKILRCAVTTRSFEADRGELTATGKLRRAAVADNFRDPLAALQNDLPVRSEEIAFVVSVGS